MIYKFKSKASGDIIMMGPTGDALLRAIGRDPAPKGIIEPAAMAAAMAGIEQAVLADEAARAEAEQERAGSGARGRLAAARARRPQFGNLARPQSRFRRGGRRRGSKLSRAGPSRHDFDTVRKARSGA